MPSLATRFAYEQGQGGRNSLAQQIAGLTITTTAQSNALDGLIAQEDFLSGPGGIAQLLTQNNAIIRLLSGIYLTLLEGEPSPLLADDDIESLIQEITP